MRTNAFVLGIAVLAFATLPALAATTYQYDTLGQLWKVCYDNGLTITYSYDAMGNRSSVATQSGVTCS